MKFEQGRVWTGTSGGCHRRASVNGLWSRWSWSSASDFLSHLSLESFPCSVRLRMSPPKNRWFFYLLFLNFLVFMYFVFSSRVYPLTRAFLWRCSDRRSNDTPSTLFQVIRTWRHVLLGLKTRIENQSQVLELLMNLRCCGVDYAQADPRRIVLAAVEEQIGIFAHSEMIREVFKLIEKAFPSVYISMIDTKVSKTFVDWQKLNDWQSKWTEICNLKVSYLIALVMKYNFLESSLTRLTKKGWWISKFERQNEQLWLCSEEHWLNLEAHTLTFGKIRTLSAQARKWINLVTHKSEWSVFT